MAKIVFKELTSNQNVIFPVSLSEKIAPVIILFVQNSVVDALILVVCSGHIKEEVYQQLPSPV